MFPQPRIVIGLLFLKLSLDGRLFSTRRSCREEKKRNKGQLDDDKCRQKRAEVELQRLICHTYFSKFQSVPLKKKVLVIVLLKLDLPFYMAS